MAVKLSKASLLPSLNNDRSDELNFRKDEIEHFENLLKFAASICPSSVEPKTSSQQVEDIEKVRSYELNILQYSFIIKT
jgi:hypothetical protein